MDPELTRLIAQISVPLGGPMGGLQGIGPLGGVDPLTGIFTRFTEASAADKFELALSVTVGVLTVSAGIWFILQLFLGAIQWLSSGGEKTAIQNSSKRIVNAIVGLGLVVLAYTLIAIIGGVFGISILGPASYILGLHP